MKNSTGSHENVVSEITKRDGSGMRFYSVAGVRW